MEEDIQIVLKWNLARGLIARAANAKPIAHEEVPNRGIDEVVDWFDDEIRGWGRSRLLYTWYSGTPSSSGDNVICRRVSIKCDDLPLPVGKV
jgi:hypothetical protein